MKIREDKPLIKEPDPQGIADELKREPRWCTWRSEPRDGRWTKVPYNPSDGTKASSTKSETWSSFQQAVHAYDTGEYDGIGFFLGDGFVGVDLDHCRDPETGEIDSCAQNIKASLPTYYWEVSPSGTGLHGIGRGGEWLNDVEGRRRGDVEIYSVGRYFTVTGHRLCEVAMISNCDEALRRIHEEHVARLDSSTVPVTWSAEQVEERRRQFTDEMIFEELAKDGDEFSRLWEGKWEDKYPSQSEADLGLASRLAFYCGADPERIERLFSRSKLAVRSKWRARADYRQRTIAKAIEGSVHESCSSENPSARYIPKPISLEDARGVVARVLEHARENQSAPFENVALRALHVLKKEAHAEFERVRMELKASTVRVSHLDDVMQEHAISESHGPPNALGLDEILAEAELFHTPDQIGYITILMAGHRETWPIFSRQFKRYLIRLIFSKTKEPPSDQELKEILALIDARAQFDGEERDVFVRVADFENRIYIDLCNSDWQAVEVTPLGYRVVDEPPVRFRQCRGMFDLPQPVAGGSIEALRRFLNVAGEASWILVIVWVLMALRPRGPYPVLGLHGEQGSAKSTTSRVLRSLIDPSKAPLRSAPRDGRDLMIAANNSWLMCFDNLSRIRPWLSDGICRLATGGGFATRQLYTDEEEVLFDAQRPVLLNGIEEIAERGDLVERSIIVELPPIPEEEREAEASFWADFESAFPEIFGALLTALSGALRELPQVEIERCPRMADFAMFGVAVERFFGWPEGSFLEAYRANIAGATQTALEASNLAPVVIDFVKQHPDWVGTATELRKTFSSMVDESVLHQKWWPKQPNSLAGALKRLAPSLRKVGIHVEFERHGKNKVRQIRFKQRKRSSPPSPSSPVSTSEVKATTCLFGLGDKADDGGTIAVQLRRDRPPLAETGPVVTGETTGTSPGADDGDDGDDHLQTSESPGGDIEEVTI